MAQVGVLRFLDYSGIDIAASIASAHEWVSEVIPLKEGVDRQELRRRSSLLAPGGDT